VGKWERLKFGSLIKKLYICIIKIINNMFETFLMVILLPASIIFNIVLILRGIEFVKQNEKLVDTIKDYDLRQDNTLITLENMLGEMKEIDLKGSFESDDEVGVVFSELKNTIESYKNKI
jgi:hypothetical protein